MALLPTPYLENNRGVMMSHPSVGLGREYVRQSEACILLTVQVIHSSHRLALLTPVSISTNCGSVSVTSNLSLSVVHPSPDPFFESLCWESVTIILSQPNGLVKSLSTPMTYTSMSISFRYLRIMFRGCNILG